MLSILAQMSMSKQACRGISSLRLAQACRVALRIILCSELQICTAQGSPAHVQVQL